MKKILLGSILALIMLPQFTFAANPPPAPGNPQVAACTKQIDGEWGTFFGQLGAERGAFMQANRSIIAKQDARAEYLYSHRIQDNPNAVPPDLLPQEQSVISAFMAKQQQEKAAFTAQVNQDKQNCLAGTGT